MHYILPYHFVKLKNKKLLYLRQLNLKSKFQIYQFSKPNEQGPFVEIDICQLAKIINFICDNRYVILMSVDKILKLNSQQDPQQL